MNWRERMIRRLDTTLNVLLAGIVGGSVVAFGGQVWWYAPLLATATIVLALAWGLRSAISGRFVVLRSPLAALALLVVILAVIQIAPLPEPLGTRLSARAGGGLTGESHVASGPQVVSLDRPATLRWATAALACLVVLVVAAHHVDSAGRLRLVWGSALAGFGVGTFFGVLQLAGQAPEVYGSISPEFPPWWGPSMNDRAAGPHIEHWRLLTPSGKPDSGWLSPRIESTIAVGPHVSGPGGQLALACLVLPLAFGLIVQTVAPRGSREPLIVRLRQDNGAAWLSLLGPIFLLGAGLHGYLGGPLLALPVALGLVLAVIGSCWRTGNARATLCFAVFGLGALALGSFLGAWLGRPNGTPWLADPTHWPELADLWKGAWRTGRSHPWMGVGLGAFGVVVPQIKAFDAASTSAQNSALQWWAETGVPGLLIVLAALAWIAWNLPGAWRRIGQADRGLAAALIGALVSFATFSLIHWSIQGIAVALSAAAILGTANRWLAGATDLFIEAG